MVCTSCPDIVAPPSSQMNSDEHSFEAPTGDYSRRKPASSAFSYNGLANAQQLHHRLVRPNIFTSGGQVLRNAVASGCTLMCGYTALRATQSLFHQILQSGHKDFHATDFTTNPV